MLLGWSRRDDQNRKDAPADNHWRAWENGLGAVAGIGDPGTERTSPSAGITDPGYNFGDPLRAIPVGAKFENASELVIRHRS